MPYTIRMLPVSPLSRQRPTFPPGTAAARAGAPDAADGRWRADPVQLLRSDDDLAVRPRWTGGRFWALLLAWAAVGERVAGPGPSVPIFSEGGLAIVGVNPTNFVVAIFRSLSLCRTSARESYQDVLASFTVRVTWIARERGGVGMMLRDASHLAGLLTRAVH